MQIVQTPLKDCFYIIPQIFEDKRGIFLESYHKQKFEEATGITSEFVQDNQSMSKFGVLRGLHFQTGEFAQAKLVRVIFGEVIDVVVDLRPESPTFKQHFKIKLNHTNQYQLYIPQGFGHGFVTLTETSVFAYKCDRFYHLGAESGVIYNDPDLNIDWEIKKENLILSNKDIELPKFKDIF